MKVAVIGAGWAGMAAAIAHAQAGHAVTVLESARTVGGRARAVQASLPDGTAATLDNGQHILIGAYTESLRLMRLVGVDAEKSLLRLPLALQFPDGTGLALPDLAPPLDAVLGIARARGWGWRDKLALLRAASGWQLGGFRCAPTVSVAQLCTGLPQRLVAEFIDPLCVSALNTPAHEASGQVFLRVLQDSLFSGRGGSNLLLPRVNLGALFPEAAARWLAEQHQGAVHTGQRVQGIGQRADGRWELQGTDFPGPFDHIALACPPWEASRLVATATGVAAAHDATRQQWCSAADNLRFEAITTVYAHGTGARLPQPMVALRNSAELPAQFVFDRGQLDGLHGVLAFVVSASTGERSVVTDQVLRQAGEQLGLPGLSALQTVVEKRATFACTPALVRPSMQVAPGLVACGDYVDGPYPATLEGAVLCGTAAAAALAANPG